MIRNKIEKWILSEHHIKYPNLIVGLTITCSIILVGAMLFYIKYSQCINNKQNKTKNYIWKRNIK